MISASQFMVHCFAACGARKNAGSKISASLLVMLIFAACGAGTKVCR